MLAKNDSEWKNRLAELEACADVLGLAISEEGANVEGVRQAGLHADYDVEGLN